MPKAVWNGEVIAESPDTVVVDGNHYFPRAAVRAECLESSDLTSHCSWKGDASYFTVVAGGQKNPDAAWYYPDPKPKAANIKDHVAFWKGIEVTE